MLIIRSRKTRVPEYLGYFYQVYHNAEIIVICSQCNNWRNILPSPVYGFISTIMCLVFVTIIFKDRAISIEQNNFVINHLITLWADFIWDICKVQIAGVNANMANIQCSNITTKLTTSIWYLWYRLRKLSIMIAKWFNNATLSQTYNSLKLEALVVVIPRAPSHQSCDLGATPRLCEGHNTRYGFVMAL